MTREPRTAVPAPGADPVYDDRAACLQWVFDDLTEDVLPPLHRTTLSREPNRDDWFRFLPEMDYEVKGGTWEEPRWAWEEHPWFAALGLTREECEDFLRGGAA